jgi:uncharacterized radical SAM superfamily Fe-S cluster-containing enzyme
MELLQAAWQEAEKNTLNCRKKRKHKQRVTKPETIHIIEEQTNDTHKQFKP